MTWILRWSWLGGLILLFSGCSLKEYRLFQEKTEPPVTQVDDKQYQEEMVFENKIVPGDRIKVSVYNQLGGSGEMTSMVGSRTNVDSMNNDEAIGLLVTKTGTVRLPLIGAQKVSGMTEDAAASYLMEQYKKYLRNPYVTVEITNQRVYILGEVQKPGVVPVTNGTMNLVEAIARSNDLTDFADRTRIKVIRGNLRDPEVKVIDLTQMSSIRLSSLYLQPNDIVYVQPRDMKGYNIAFKEISPPFELLATILQPFVNIVFLYKALQ